MRKLSRKKSHREALLKNLATSVILYERVVTTITRAKAIQRYLDKMINLGKKTDLTSYRRLINWFPEPNAPKKIHEVLSHHFSDRSSGFSRIVHLGPRHGDGAEMALVELIGLTTTKPAQAKTRVVTETITKPARRLNPLGRKAPTVTVRKRTTKKESA